MLKTGLQDIRCNYPLNMSAGDGDSSNSRRCKQTDPWSREEDEVVMRLVGHYGPTRWALIASNLPGRKGKQCRERWHNQLDPNIIKEGWTDEEDRILSKAHSEVTCFSFILLWSYAINQAVSYSSGTDG